MMRISHLLSIFSITVLLLTSCHTLPEQSISLSGSASMEQAVTALGEDFFNLQGIAVSAQFGGSTQGIRDATEGKTDIGCSSRSLTEEEHLSLNAVPIAIDSIALIVHPDNPVSGLTSGQLSDIYTGVITNWKDVGGLDSPIVVIGRDSASGMRAAFECLLQISGQCRYIQERDSSGGVRIAVETTPEAIGYVSLEAADTGETVKTLSVNGIMPGETGSDTEEYPLSHPLYLVTKKDPLKKEILLFLDYVLSERGQSVLISQKLIPIV